MRNGCVLIWIKKWCEREWREFRNSKLAGGNLAIYNYIADFCCCEKMLIIEVDGSVHDQQVEHDKDRDRNLESLGYKVIRFSNENILFDIENVVSKISQLLEGGRGFGLSSKPKVERGCRNPGAITEYYARRQNGECLEAYNGKYFLVEVCREVAGSAPGSILNSCVSGLTPDFSAGNNQKVWVVILRSC